MEEGVREKGGGVGKGRWGEVEVVGWKGLGGRGWVEGGEGWKRR